MITIEKLMNKYPFDSFDGVLIDNFIFYLDDGTYLVALEKATTTWTSEHTFIHTDNIDQFKERI